MDDSKEMVFVEYECGHTDSTFMKYTVDIWASTLKFVLVQGNTKNGPIKGRIEFKCRPYVGGRVTVEYYRMVVGSPGTSPTKNLLQKSEPPHPVTKNRIKHIKEEMEFDILLVGLKEQYKVEILSVPTEGDCKVSQLTLAVIEKVKGEMKIRVTDQIVWLNNIPRYCHEVTGILKSLNMVDDGQCQRCLDLENPGSRVPFENITVRHVGEAPTGMFNGTFHNRDCAVKRYPIGEKQAADNNIEMMKDIDHHSNIVSYYGMADDGDYVLVAVERCNSSLDRLIGSRVFEDNKYKLTLEGFKDLVLWEHKKVPTTPSSNDPQPDTREAYPSDQLVKILRGIVSGLCWVHSHSISHNNLKGENVLIRRHTNVSKTIPKLSNFSLSRKLGTPGVGGSEGSQPTFDDDLEKLAILLLDCIAIPHDESIMEEYEEKLKRVEYLAEAYDLISQLKVCEPNDGEPKIRTAAKAYNHPFFWKTKKRLEFLRTACDHLDIKGKFEDIRVGLLEPEDYKDWKEKKTLDLELIREIRHTFQRYDGLSLLKLIRNAISHYVEVTGKLAQNLVAFDEHVRGCYPKFFMLVYNLFKPHQGTGHKLLDEYFEPWKF